MQTANRLHRLPSYLFAELEAKAAELRKRGIDLINLGIADPDLPPPGFLKEAIKNHLDDPDAHRYPSSRGDVEVRKAVARWFLKRFEVELDPEREVVITLGSKGGLADLSRALVNPRDSVAVPDPGYPVYHGAGAILNDANPLNLALTPQTSFLPDLKEAEGASILFLNYPNNPTGAIALESFYRQAADFSESHPETLVVWDAAYCEMTFDNYCTPSLISYTRKAVELHSLSKMMNCTGYRVGFAVGEAEALEAMVRIKTQVDSGTQVFIQRAMADALEHYQGSFPPEEIMNSHKLYGKRKKFVEEAFRSIDGIQQVYPSPATFFIWAKVNDDLEFVEKALEKGVILTPGRGFGERGRGYIRTAVTAPDDRIEEALERLCRL